MKNISDQAMHLDIYSYKENVFETVEYIKDFILNNECSTLSVNISRLNLIDASKISILCSTFHFSKYPDGEITWYVNDRETLQTIKLMKLKNTKFEIKQFNNKPKCTVCKSNQRVLITV